MRSEKLKEESWVNVSLSFTGDPFRFWSLLKAMKAQAEKDGVIFDCGQVTTVTHEGGREGT